MSKNDYRVAREILKMEITVNAKTTSNELAVRTQKYLKSINEVIISRKKVGCQV